MMEFAVHRSDYISIHTVTAIMVTNAIQLWEQIPVMVHHSLP